MIASAIPPNCLRRASRPHSGFKLMFARRRYGAMMRHCTTTPSVVPALTKRMCGSVTGDGDSGVSEPGTKW